MSYLLIVEGQEIPLTAEIAATDETIRNCIAPFYPEAATASFKRELSDGVTRIRMIKTAGTKGCHQFGEEKIRQGSSPIDKLLGTTDLPKSLALFSKPCLGNVIQQLQQGKECLNPALALSWQLKQLERQNSIQIETLIGLQVQIDNAIAIGREWELSVQTTLDRLKQTQPSPSQLSIVGF